MKKLIYLFILTFGLNAFSQKNDQPPIIFEGVAVAATEFFIDSTGAPNTNTTGEHGLRSFYTTNTSYLVKVTKVLKGQEFLDTGYVEVITKLSYMHINNQGVHGGIYENYIPNLYPGIFFMELNTVPATLDRKTNNEVVLQPFHFKPMKIDLNRYDCFAIDYHRDKCFKTENDLVNYLKKEYNVDYLNSPNYGDIHIDTEHPPLKKKSASSNAGLVKNKDYQSNLNNYNQFISNTKNKQNNQDKFVSKSISTLNLELGNETKTENGK